MKTGIERIFSCLLISALLGCGSGVPESVVPIDSPVSSRDLYPVRALPNIGATCYVNTALHLMRKLERIPVVPISKLHQDALDRFSKLFAEFQVDPPTSKKEVMKQDLVESFRDAWNLYIESQELKDRLNADFRTDLPDYLLWKSFSPQNVRQEKYIEWKTSFCKIVPMGSPGSTYLCFKEHLGFGPRLSIEIDKGQFVAPVPLGSRAVLVERNPRDHWYKESVKKQFKVGFTVEVSGEKFRVVACEGPSGHFSALVEDRVVRDGVEKMEVFHYDDEKIAWIEDPSSEDNQCVGHYMVLEPVQ